MYTFVQINVSDKMSLQNFCALLPTIFFHPNPVVEQENQEKSYEKCWQASSISMNELLFFTCIKDFLKGKYYTANLVHFKS